MVTSPTTYKWVLAPVGMALSLAGCTEFNTKPVTVGNTSALATRADVRLVFERSTVDGKRVLCAEPSPDVALALSKAIDLDVKVKAVDVGGGYGTSQALLGLAGRTAGVVALRDGLTQACLAYTNNVIGRDSYAMILSNYGDLLVTLMLGEDAGGVPNPAQTTVTTDQVTPHTVPPAETSGTPATDAATHTTSTTSTASAAFDPINMPRLQHARLIIPVGVVNGALKSLLIDDAVAVNPTGSAKGADANKTTSTTPTAPTTPTTPSGETPSGGASAVASIAGRYYDNEPARLLKTMFVLCVTASERRREYPSSAHTTSIATLPDPKSGQIIPVADFTDVMCSVMLNEMRIGLPAILNKMVAGGEQLTLTPAPTKSVDLAKKAVRTVTKVRKFRVKPTNAAGTR
jgi:hypothetical protein